MVQWLALGAFAAVGLSSMVGQRTKILLNHAAQLKKKKKKKKKKKRETLRDHACNPSALQTRLKRIRTFFPSEIFLEALIVNLDK